MKYCWMCRELKDEAKFGADKSRPDGLNPKCRDCNRAASMDNRSKHPEEMREYWRNKRREYRYKELGITERQYQELLESQNNGCAICKGQNQDGRRLVVDHDHDHETGEVRGLLCTACNRAIGSFDDDPNLVLDAYAYLMRSSVQIQLS